MQRPEVLPRAVDGAPARRARRPGLAPSRALARLLALATALAASYAIGTDFSWPRHDPHAAPSPHTPHGAKGAASASGKAGTSTSAKAASSPTAKSASAASAKAASAPASAASATWNGTVLRVARLSAGGSQTLQDAVRTFGQAPLERVSAASEGGAASAPAASSALCYDIGEPRARFSLRFFSDGEKAEPAGQITALTITQLTPEDAGWENCRRNARRTSGLVDGHGLNLGMQQAAIHRLLGPPRASGEGGDEFSACTRRYLERRSSAYAKWAGKPGCFENAAKPYANDCTAVHVEYRNGAASLISVGVNSSMC